jgi:hypothetical protein
MFPGSSQKTTVEDASLPANAMANPVIPKILNINSLDSIFCGTNGQSATNNSFITKNLRFECKKNLSVHARETGESHHYPL